jgi:hypothetical protein
MTENIDPRTDPQFKALMQVMNDITGNKVPFYEPHELSSAQHTCVRCNIKLMIATCLMTAS